ncbi:CRISPR-associated protein Cas4 [Sphingobacterium sp. SRCM116780]|uniref:CRISPR-associated protein Cas4 n=1 Tax=Sphingobacterium sp. SRCM116780 TaxID=2907623 RepID=UPI001F3F4D4E|nr:CRISPR-associated protein Cas4 [Sphingobacterium sp. SRCM116780]UIR57325.1 CRISPR-associated protein Cas4 [Sphingobacterium sp. SRCM116780]
MNIIATHINYYQICKRKLWFFTNGINMEHTSDIVYDGKLLHENSYPQRNNKHSEITLSASFERIELYGKIDFYDALKKTVHETKRSDKVEVAHEWQVKFYLWLLKLNGVEDATAILEYPLLRQRDVLRLTEKDIEELKSSIKGIAELRNSELCPSVIKAKICKSCSYYELCYINEE